MDGNAVVEGGLPDDLRFDVRAPASAGPWTVTVIGEVDCRTAPSLRAVLRDVLAGPDLPAGLVVDLSGATFLDAWGLTVLAVAHHFARSAGRVVGIRCGTARAVICPLQITGLWSDLTIIDRWPTDT
jgi:anti-sigma B factor antagonist